MYNLNIPRESTMQDILGDLQRIAIMQAANIPAVMGWEAVRNVIRSGYGPQVFPVGTQLQVEHSTYGNIIWDVVAHNYDRDPQGRYQYSMTLLSHGCVLSLYFTAAKALYYCESGLPAGIYHFTLPAGYEEALGGGKTYQFTLSQAIPAKGQIAFGWKSNTQVLDTEIITYASATATDAIETVNVTVGTEGTNLGTADGKTPNMCPIQCARFGYNNWRKSAARQILNSDKETGKVWTPQTIFDRPPSWHSTWDGFMRGLPEDFLEVVGPVKHKTRTNKVYEIDDVTGSFYETEDTFFLPSHSELYGDADGTVEDGTQYPFFAGAPKESRIKYNVSDESAKSWAMRSPYPGDEYNIRVTGTTGNEGVGLSVNSKGIAIACAIY